MVPKATSLPLRENVRKLVQLGVLAVELGGIGQTHQAGHLRGRRRNIGRLEFFELGEVLPVAVFVEQAGGEVAVHGAAGRGGLGFYVGVGVELGEVLLQA